MWQTYSHRIKSWWWYQKTAQTRYYIHSPFVFQFYINVLDAAMDADCQRIQEELTVLQNNYSPITIEDFGAKKGTYTSSVSHLAKQVAIEPKYGKVLHEFLKQSEAIYVLELGTSLGIGSAFIASSKKELQLTTIDASKSVLSYAQNLHTKLGLRNITYIQSEFDKVLPKMLQDMPRLDVAFVDGNHTYEATIRYFNLLLKKKHENTVLIFDDIYWSEEMTTAWEEIKANPKVKLTIDLFRIGFVFFREDNLAKENFVLRY